MSFGSPETSKEFPGLYGHERQSDSDSEAQASKQLIGKRKDKKEKDIGYAALGDSSGGEEEDGKSPLRGKLGNPFKFSKKEKREKDKQKEHKDKELKTKETKEKELKTKEIKEKDLKLRKDARELYREEKLKEKEKHKEEKHKEKEKLKEEKIKERAKEKTKEEKSKEKSKEGKELKHKESIKGSPEGRKKKKKETNKGNERKKSVPAAVAEEEEPVFGVPLALAVERSKCHDGVQLPAVVRECIDYIEQNGLNCEGIYRLSGVKSKVQQLKRGYNQRDTVCLYDHEPHTVASLLKLFLRELPEPVLTAELLPQFEAAAGQKDPERRVQQLSELLDRLPDPNRLLVQYMFKHMEHIIKREKINKMNVQNVSLVLSPTMIISHRVLNAFFLYGKILFSGATIKRYVPPIADGELPDSAEAIREEIEKQESLLSQLHQQLKSGSINQRREEQLWEAQRILTQLKRRQRFVSKRSETESGSRPAESEAAGDAASASDDAASASSAGAASTTTATTATAAATAAASAQRLERTVQIINEDNVTVIQIGEKAASSSAAAPAAAAAGTDAGGEQAAARTAQSAASGSESGGSSPKPTSAAGPESASEVEPAAGSESAAGTEPAAEVESEAAAASEPQPTPPPEPEPLPGRKMSSAAPAETKSQPEPEPSQKSEPQPGRKMSSAAPAETKSQPEPEPSQKSEPQPGRKMSSAAPAQTKSQPEPTPKPEPVQPAPEPELKPEPEAGDGDAAAMNTLPPPGDESQASFSDLHRRIVADVARPVEPAAPAAPPATEASVASAPVSGGPTADSTEADETADLLRQLILLKLEEDELVSTGRELRNRLAAERSEIGRLKDTIQEMETLYKYRTYSVDSSDDSSGEDSDDGDTEEDMVRQLQEIIRHNQQIEVKNAQLVRAIHEERRICQKRRAQIRYLELQSVGP